MPNNLPKQIIISLKDLFLHDEPDLSPLEQFEGKLIQLGILRNPLLVMSTKTSNKHYMVLDSANRATTFKILGYPHIIAQIIQNADSAINLLSRNHLV